jgi:hypothetical protein
VVYFNINIPCLASDQPRGGRNTAYDLCCQSF